MIQSRHTWETWDDICEERKSGIESASVGSTGVKMLSDASEAHVNIADLLS